MNRITTFEEEFEHRNPDRTQIIRFMREAIGVDEVKWADLTINNLTQVRDYLMQKLSPNSAHVYCAIIRAFLNLYCEDVDLPTTRYAKALKVKSVPSQHCCLTEEELIKFDEYRPRNQQERDVKILFMRGAFSGARSSDCRTMTVQNVSGDTLSYVSKKTKVAVEQPLHERLLKYLQMSPSEELDRCRTNRIIRRICRNLGFNESVTLYCNGRTQTKPKYEWITMHSSRRSFVTALALRGVPIEVIAKLAGHVSSQTTSKHYVCIDTKKLSDDAMVFYRRSSYERRNA